MRARWYVGLSLCLVCLPAARGDEWPQFRGPGGAGLPADKGLPAEWGPEKNVQWKVKLPGVAWSCPVVWGDKVFVTTAVTDNQRKPRPGGGFGGPGRGDGEARPARRPEQPGGAPPAFPPGGRGGRGGRPPDQLYRWEVLCLDRATGKILWQQLALEAKPRIPTHGSNTYASETPVTDGERVYAYFAMHGLFCYDLTGNQVWKKDLGSYPMAMGWGTSSSPVFDGERLFVLCDNEQKSFLVALAKKTGEEVWRVERDEKSTWATPCLWKNKQRTELVTVGAKKIRSYDPATGKLLWELGMGGGRCTATPVGDDEMLYVGAAGGFGGGGFGRFGGGPGGAPPGAPPGGGRGGPRGGGMMGGGGGLFAVRAGASGDITPKKGETTSAGVAWSQPKGGPSMASPLVYQGHVYILEQRGGMMSCYDAKTGKPAYSKERIVGAGAFWASPWASDGKIFCLDDNGKTFMVQAGPTFKVLGNNALNEMTWATPAIAGGAIFVRGVDHLYCIKQ